MSTVTVQGIIDAAPEGAGAEVDYLTVASHRFGCVDLIVTPRLVAYLLPLDVDDYEADCAAAQGFAARRWPTVEIDTWDAWLPLTEDCDLLCYPRTDLAGSSSADALLELGPGVDAALARRSERTK